MELNFTAEPQLKQLRFADVEVNQFFVCKDGFLCQKVGDTTYLYIANKDGTPWASYETEVEEYGPITRILPKVTKINF